MAEKRINLVFTVIIAAVIILITAFYITAVNVFPKSYGEEISAASEKYGIDADLIRAVIWTESKFDEDAVSSKGASGLMQMMPATRVEQSTVSGIPADGTARTEILLGTGYLIRMIEATDTLDDALMAYNAGLKNVQTWDKPYKESTDYVKRVHLALNVYKYIR